MISKYTVIKLEKLPAAAPQAPRSEKGKQLTSTTTPTLPTAGEHLEGVDGWRISNMRIEVHGHLIIEIENSDQSASANLSLSPQGATGEALVSTRYGDVAYGTYSGIGVAELAEITKKFASCLEQGLTDLPRIFPHLLVPSNDIHQSPEQRALLGSVLAGRPLLTADEEPNEQGVIIPQEFDALFFDPVGLAEFLEPEFVIDGQEVMGFVLRSVSIPPMARREGPDFKSFILTLEPDDGGEECQVIVGTLDALSQPFGTAGEIAVGLRHFGRGESDTLPPAAARICSWLLALITLKQSRGFTLDIPATAQSARALSVPVASHKITDVIVDGPPLPESPPETPALNLTIDAECEQSCSFCSLKSFLPASDGGEKELEYIRLQLENARAKGIRELRLNGIDPLAFSQIFEALEQIRDMGFEELTLYTPGRQLADPSFRARFLELAPEKFKVVIPIYGLSDEIHDAITGFEGSFVQVQAAIKGMLADADLEHTALSTVVVKQNVRVFTQMVAWARELGLEFQAHLPYPMKQSIRDNYVKAATSEEEVLQTFLQTLHAIPENIRDDASAWLGETLSHPCLLWNAEQKSHHPFLRERVLSSSNLMDGTDYRSDRYAHGSDAQVESTAFAAATIPCPHLDDCALSPVCSGEHYALYEQTFGLDEFKPVSVLDIYTAMGDADFRASRLNQDLSLALQGLEENARKGLERLEKEVKRQSRNQSTQKEGASEEGHRNQLEGMRKLGVASQRFSQNLRKDHEKLQKSLRHLSGLAQVFGDSILSPSSYGWVFSSSRIKLRISREIIQQFRRKIGGESLRIVHQLQAHMNDTQRSMAHHSQRKPMNISEPGFNADSVASALDTRLATAGVTTQRGAFAVLALTVGGASLLAGTAFIRISSPGWWLALGAGGLAYVLALLQASRLRRHITQQITGALSSTFYEHWSTVEAVLEDEWKSLQSHWALSATDLHVSTPSPTESENELPEAISTEFQAMRSLLNSKNETTGGSTP